MFLWRLPSGALRDADFREEVREAIVLFFDENRGSVMTAGTLWEAFKVVIRGVCLSKQHGMLKTLCQVLMELEGRIAELVENWSGEVLGELRSVVSLYEEASLREICFLGRTAWARRCGARDQRVVGTSGVMQVFTQYFKQLYVDPVVLDAAAAHAYFSEIALVWFGDAH
ncbi:hypothetical protein NDU88_006932 [Pleurodeles waltl]|uniref:Uncharacterized protein n=1 Tax=Pleurodeles waltl TaxID=8319 RepID=A0AAV7QQ13_PLEWA|nr:hypothetical protein NDU88_006932 [Pleurodeles waltl]